MKKILFSFSITLLILFCTTSFAGDNVIEETKDTITRDVKAIKEQVPDDIKEAKEEFIKKTNEVKESATQEAKEIGEGFKKTLQPETYENKTD
jgi:hypothetical protein